MATEKQKWRKTIHSPVTLLLIGVWLLVTYLLYKSWKDDMPFLMGMAMPF
jgi:hypothetical protein